MINLSNIIPASCPNCPQEVREDHKDIVWLALEYLYTHSPSAKSLIQQLNKSKYLINVVPHLASKECPYRTDSYKPEKDTSYAAVPSNVNDSTSGKGTDGVIIFPPYAVSPLAIKDLTEKELFYPSKARILAHELIHALHFAKGCSKTEFKAENSEAYEDKEEEFTIEGISGEESITENAIAEELGEPKRFTHDAATFDSLALKEDFIKLPKYLDLTGNEIELNGLNYEPSTLDKNPQILRMSPTEATCLALRSTFKERPFQKNTMSEEPSSPQVAKKRKI